MKALVLSKKEYAFDDMEGCTLFYLNLDDESVTGEGFAPLKMSVSKDSDIYRNTAGVYPALYDVDYAIVPGKGNKASLKVSTLERIKDVSLCDLVG